MGGEWEEGEYGEERVMTTWKGKYACCRSFAKICILGFLKNKYICQKSSFNK